MTKAISVGTAAVALVEKASDERPYSVWIQNLQADADVYIIGDPSLPLAQGIQLLRAQANVQPTILTLDYVTKPLWLIASGTSDVRVRVVELKQVQLTYMATAAK